MMRRHTPLESEPVTPEVCTLDVRLQVLHQVPYFVDLNHTEVAEINRSFAAHGYQADEAIYFTGDAANRLYKDFYKKTYKHSLLDKQLAFSYALCRMRYATFHPKPTNPKFHGSFG